EERITREITRSRKIDRPLRGACGLWQKAKTRNERLKALQAEFKALAETEGPLLEQYNDLTQLDVPLRHLDLLGALREAVRLEIMICRRLPPAFLTGNDRQIGLWTSVLNDTLNPKAKMAGVDPFAEARGETKKR
ncbi:MAG: hypothetical protein ACYS99_12140, partial [Planctomycetota bacterium]